VSRAAGARFIDETRSLVALGALNFFKADVRDGLGPFLGVYLQARDWSPAEIGTVVTIGGLAGMAATTPAGLLVDHTHAKRAIMVAAALAVVVASLALLFFPSFVFTAATQVVSGTAGAVIPAAIAAITLGIVKQKGYAHQLGHNEAFNHAGNLTAAMLAGAFGYIFGLGAVFVVMAAMAVGSMIATALIDPRDIDDRAARGCSESPADPVGGDAGGHSRSVWHSSGNARSMRRNPKLARSRFRPVC
jgi:MFS family permease